MEQFISIFRTEALKEDLHPVNKNIKVSSYCKYCSCWCLKNAHLPVPGYSDIVTDPALCQSLDPGAGILTVGSRLTPWGFTAGCEPCCATWIVPQSLFGPVTCAKRLWTEGEFPLGWPWRYNRKWERVFVKIMYPLPAPPTKKIDFKYGRGEQGDGGSRRKSGTSPFGWNFISSTFSQQLSSPCSPSKSSGFLL